jgi:hypothetical protein
MEQGILLTEQELFLPNRNSRPNRELTSINFLTVRRYPTKFPLTRRGRSTSATADGFDRNFGIGRGGDAPRQLIGSPISCSRVASTIWQNMVSAIRRDQRRRLHERHPFIG